jgi:hypothetical protein
VFIGLSVSFNLKTVSRIFTKLSMDGSVPLEATPESYFLIFTGRNKHVKDN